MCVCVCVCVCAHATERKREVGGHVSEGHASAIHVLGRSERPGGTHPNTHGAGEVDT